MLSSGFGLGFGAFQVEFQVSAPDHSPITHRAGPPASPSRMIRNPVLAGRWQGLGFRAWFRVQGSGFRVQGSGFRVQGLGFRV